jgi:hypothetical protein
MNKPHLRVVMSAAVLAIAGLMFLVKFGWQAASDDGSGGGPALD